MSEIRFCPFCVYKKTECVKDYEYTKYSTCDRVIWTRRSGLVGTVVRKEGTLPLLNDEESETIALSELDVPADGGYYCSRCGEKVAGRNGYVPFKTYKRYLQHVENKGI